MGATEPEQPLKPRPRTPRRAAERLSRACFAAAVSVLLLGSLGSFGDLGYAAVGYATAVPEKIAGVVRDALGAPHPLRTVARSPAQDQYGPEKVTVTICHRTGNGKRITISGIAPPAHLAHGDSVGGCPTAAGVQGEQGSPGRKRAAGDGGMLASTGVSLAVTLLLSLLLIAAGLALRRVQAADA